MSDYSDNLSIFPFKWHWKDSVSIQLLGRRINYIKMRQMGLKIVKYVETIKKLILFSWLHKNIQQAGQLIEELECYDFADYLILSDWTSVLFFSTYRSPIISFVSPADEQNGKELLAEHLFCF